MTFLWNVKETIKKNTIALYIIETRKKLLYRFYEKKYSDREFVEWFYEKKIGEKPNLDNPKKLTEKLQWLKLNYRNPIIPICSDKYEAKGYIKELDIPGLNIIPNLAVYNSADELDVNKLPDEFIIKATHGSGWNVICRDKSKIDWKNKKKVMNTWLSENLYIYGREWNYKEQTPRLIVEPLMDTKPLVDYKFICCNGKCKAMQVNHDIGDKHYVDYYDGEWNLFPDMNCGVALNSGKPVEKPEQFEEMKEIAEKLAKPFPFVRVDLYNIKGKIYFGEMTFFPGSGFWKITPEKYDKMFGDWIELPKI